MAKGTKPYSAITIATLAMIVVLLTGCTNVSERRDTIIGGVAGCATGYAACLLAKANPVVCAAACVVGAVVGVNIGAYLDNRRHKLEQAAKEVNLALAVSYVSATPPPVVASDSGEATESKSSAGSTSDDDSSPTQNGMVAEINVDTMFASGSARLTPDANAKFVHIAKVYAQRSDSTGRKVDTKLLITGHTDSSGPAALNQQLSEFRAKAVASVFAGVGIPTVDIYVKGAGSAQPIADNLTTSGRNRNRRVEILEIENEKDLVSYSIARRQDRRNLIYSTAAADNGVSTNLPVSRVQSPPPTSHSSGSTAPTTGSVGPQRVTLQDYGFQGQPAQNKEDDLQKIIGNPPRHLLWQMVPISTANAAVSINACYLDQPHIDGDVVRYSDGTKVESHPIADYLPGMFGGGWDGAVGRSKVGFSPVAVLREDVQAVGNPTVFVQRPGQSSPERFQGTVNTYEGKEGVLYRVYLDESAAAIKCFDVVLPKQSKLFQSPAGRIFYKDNGAWKQAEFRPALVTDAPKT